MTRPAPVARGPLAALLTCLIAALVALPAGATLLPRLTPEEIQFRADRVVVATCLGADTVDHPTLGMEVTDWCFRLESVEKGQKLAEDLAAGRDLLVVRQAGGTSPSVRNWMLAGMPYYELGGRYRLFLRPDTALGMTSPVGLRQGVERLDAGESR